MARSRQVGLLHRAMQHPTGTWTAFLQHWVSEWRGDWEGGWNGLLNPHPKAHGNNPWTQTISLWQNMKWKAESPTTPWEARAVPLAPP